MADSWAIKHAPLRNFSDAVLKADDFNADPVSLAGRNVVITGAASEIGGALGLVVARSGAVVALLDRKQRELIPLYDRICESGYAEPLMVEMDIRRARPEDFMRLAESLSRSYHEIHGLAHCAMWGAPLTPIAHSSMQVWQKILESTADTTDVPDPLPVSATETP